MTRIRDRGGGQLGALGQAREGDGVGHLAREGVQGETVLREGNGDLRTHGPGAEDDEEDDGETRAERALASLGLRSGDT